MISKCNCLEITAEHIIESSSSSMIILDIREPTFYEKSHIKDSINVLTSNLLLRRLQRGSLTISNLLPENVVVNLENNICDSIVLYDECSSTEEMNRNLSIIVTAMKKSYPDKNIFFLEKGFENFIHEFPQACQCKFDFNQISNPLQISLVPDFTTSDPTDKNAFSPHTDLCPVSILSYLYLGSANHASQQELLDKLGITAILNVSKTIPSAFTHSYEYMNIAIEDNARENISSHFDDAINFIEDINTRGGRVLVHCHAGISRSATICIAYLMRQKSLSLDEAYEFTKKRRSAISPNFNFLGQLLAFERELKEQRQLNNNNNKARPATALPPKLRLNFNNAPLTSQQMEKDTDYFTYSPLPKNCLSFFDGSEMTSPGLALMTPS